jgi:hypothetical protein
MACPACKLPFHAECWNENRGCSAFGCSQVNVKEKPIVIEPVMVANPGDRTREPPPAEFPHEYLYLAASVCCFVLSLFTWGCPSLLCLLGVMVLLAKNREPRHPSILLLGVLASILGLVIGALVSRSLWLD